MSSHEFTGPMLKMLALVLQSSAIIQSLKTWLPDMSSHEFTGPMLKMLALDLLSSAIIQS